MTLYEQQPVPTQTPTSEQKAKIAEDQAIKGKAFAKRVAKYIPHPFPKGVDDMIANARALNNLWQPRMMQELTEFESFQLCGLMMYRTYAYGTEDVYADLTPFAEATNAALVEALTVYFDIMDSLPKEQQELFLPFMDRIQDAGDMFDLFSHRARGLPPPAHPAESAAKPT